MDNRALYYRGVRRDVYMGNQTVQNTARGTNVLQIQGELERTLVSNDEQAKWY